MSASLGNPVLANLVEQRLVADLQQDGGLLTVPVSLLEGLRDGGGLGFVLGAARERLEAACRRIGSGFAAAIRALAAVHVVLGVEFGDSQLLVAENQIALDEVA